MNTCDCFELNLLGLAILKNGRALAALLTNIDIPIAPEYLVYAVGASTEMAKTVYQNYTL